MTQEQKNQALTILEKSHTLDEADSKLLSVKPILSRALRWGLFDGWAGRPRVGMPVAEKASSEATKRADCDYAEGCEIGRELAMRHIPA